jgi:hypothetical protein
VKVIVEKQMERRLAGETEVLGENLPQRHFCPSQNPMVMWDFVMDKSTEAKESPLLKSVTGKRLVKADCESLACVVVICKVWILVIIL